MNERMQYLFSIVIYFAGDSLLCIFEDKHELTTKALDDLSLNNLPSTARALECAAILSTCRRKSLQTHIGIAYGEMVISLLGGYEGQYVYLMSGTSISKLGTCLNMAKAKDIVVTPEFMSEYSSVSSLSNSNYVFDVDQASGNGFFVRDASRIPPIDGMLMPAQEQMNAISMQTKSIGFSFDSNTESARIDVIRSFTSASNTAYLDSISRFVAKPVLNAIYTESVDQLGELRTVTVMFLSVDSYDPTLNQDGSIFQEFFYMAQKVLSDSGGYLRQFLIDDKGCVLIAMWGVPSFTYSNNCSRALHCAALIQLNGLNATLPVKTSIGITTGTVFCGTVGSALRKDYVGIGSQVNLAARLMNKAHGKILVDTFTYTHLSPAARELVVESTPLELKGMSAPYVPYEVLEGKVPKVTTYDESIVHNKALRRKVTNTLAKILDDFLNHLAFGGKDMGKVWSVIVTGQPGTGKSLAADYVRHASHKRGIQCVRIVAYTGMKDSPYGIIRDLFFELLNCDRKKPWSAYRKAVMETIHQVFPGDDKQDARNEASFIMETIFNFEEDSIKSSNMARSPLGPKRASNSAEMMKIFTRSKSRVIVMEDNTPRFVDDACLYTIIVHLLGRLPTVLVIEDANNCDELSWRVLYTIACGSALNLVMLLTMKSAVTMRPEATGDSSKDVQRGIPADDQSDSVDFADMDQVEVPTAADMLLDETEFPSGKIKTRSGTIYLKSRGVLGGSSIIQSQSLLQSTHAIDVLSQNFSSSVSSLMHRENTFVIELSNLSRHEVQEILQRELQGQVFSDRVVDLVMRMSAGNAFWCKCIANYIREVGLAKLENTVGRALSRDSSLQVIILLRMERLPTENIIALKYAAVVGDQFTEKLMTYILPPISPKFRLHMGSILDTLCEEGFFECVQDHPTLVYSFHNRFIQNAIYDLIPPSTVAAIHESTAQYLEIEFASNLRLVYARLGFHYRHSKNNRHLAFKYEMKAADQVISKGAFTDGLRFVENAFESAATKGEWELLVDFIEGTIDDMEIAEEPHVSNDLYALLQYSHSKHEEIQQRLPLYEELLLKAREKLKEVLDLEEALLKRQSYNAGSRPVTPPSRSDSPVPKIPSRARFSNRRSPSFLAPLTWSVSNFNIKEKKFSKKNVGKDAHLDSEQEQEQEQSKVEQPGGPLPDAGLSASRTPPSAPAEETTEQDDHDQAMIHTPSEPSSPPPPSSLEKRSAAGCRCSIS